MWRALQAMPESSSDFNLKRRLLIDEGVELSAALAAVRSLVEGHQSLRAHFFPGDPPHQNVSRSGEHELVVVDTTARRVTEVIEQATLELAATAFALEQEWPVRVVLVRADGLVRALGMIMSHAAVDGFALELLMTELRARLFGIYKPAPVRWQPLEQAAFEASEAGRKRNNKSLAHWRKYLSAAPAKLFDYPPESAGELPIRRWRLDSRAIAAATQTLAVRARTSTSTVLLTVGALLLRAVSKRDAAVLKLISGNRYSAQQKVLTAATTQDGIFVCRPSGDVLSVVTQAYRDSTESYFNASYDPDELVELSAEIARARGHELDVSAYFNDARLGGEWANVPLPEISRQALDQLRATSKLTATGALPKHDMTFFLAAVATENGAGLSFLADTRRLPLAICERVLWGAESVLCEALLRPVSVNEIGALIGIP